MDHLQTQTYQHAPLDDEGRSSFRLLSILPGTEDSPILCTLQNVPWLEGEEDENSPNPKPQPQQIEADESLPSSSSPNNRSSATDEIKRDLSSHNPRPPTYNALSYAWGVEAPDRQIVINRQPFAVSPTLENAICHLRREDQPFQA